MEKIKRALGLSNLKPSINDFFLLLLPVAVWFSYHPLIGFGQTESMYLEISVSLIVLLLFSFTAIPYIIQAHKKLFSRKFNWLVLGFAVWNTFSVIWSENQLRGILTAGVVWLVVLAYFRIISHPKIKQFLPALFKIFITSAVLVSIFAWVQMILDIVGIPMEGTLICTGCQFENFGFPRATAFAIEPQFFGSLLLGPILLLIILGYKAKISKWNYVILAFLITTLFLTLSRGAIYALAIGIIILLIINFKNYKKNLMTVGLIVACMLLSFTAQGTMVALNKNVGESFRYGVAKSIHHLSLGLIDFREKVVEIEQNNEIVDEIVSGEPEETYFDGYVAESTDIRLGFTELAYDAWTASPSSVIFGVGLGGAGVAMHNANPDQVGQLEITQNEYMEILLELGIVGFVLFASIFIGVFYITRRKKWIWAIISAFVIQWLFFSGYPNVIHIYIILSTLVVFSELKLKANDNLIEKYDIFGKIA